MKKIFWLSSTLLAGFILIGFLSCQPEVQPYTQRTDSTSGSLSYVTGHTASQDSFYVSYQYDTQNRWAGNRILVITSGDTSKLKLIVTRDASGYVTKITAIDSSDLSSIDIETTLVQHNAAGQYTISYYFTNDPNVHGDTTEYIYDNNGKIIRTQERGYTYYDTITHHYTGTNLDSIISHYGNGYGNRSGFILSYDSKVAPSNLGNEAFLLELPFLYGTGNVISYTGFDGGNITEQGILTYTFNAAGKPLKVIATSLPSNQQYTGYYHYK